MAAARDVRLAFDVCFEPLSLTISQASLVGYVEANGPMTQTQLAGALVLGRAATGALVDQLEGRGLVRRVPNPADRRVWIVETTAAGSEMAARITEIDEQVRTSLRNGISQAERRELADLLLRMAANAREACQLASTKDP